MLAKPLVVVNYKVYREATGGAAFDLTRTLAEAWVAAGQPGTLVVCPQLADLRWVANHGHAPAFAQHCDALAQGAGTGHVTAEALKDAGAQGSLLNHAEHKIPHEAVAAAVKRLRALGLRSIACAKDDAEARALAKLGPDYVAVEPPELIGGDVSVTTADPEIVRASARAVRETASNVGVLCGAGVKNGADLAAALALGTDGVLLASGIVKSKDPASALADLLRGAK